MLTESAVKRLVEPAEVADLVLWLTGDTAAMVNGASYTMDGGWTATMTDIRDFPVPVDGGRLQRRRVRRPGRRPGPRDPRDHRLQPFMAGARAPAPGGAPHRSRPPRPRAEQRASRRLRPRGSTATTCGAILDVLDLDRVVVAGHSMGGFVGAAARRRRAERGCARSSSSTAASRSPTPPGNDLDALLALSPEALLGPAWERLTKVFPFRDDYERFWRGAPRVRRRLERRHRGVRRLRPRAGGQGLPPLREPGGGGGGPEGALRPRLVPATRCTASASRPRSSVPRWACRRSRPASTRRASWTRSRASSRSSRSSRCRT